MKNIKFKRRKKGLPSKAVAAICIVVCALLVAGGFLIAKHLINKGDNVKKPQGYSFETAGFENISSVACLNGEMAIFTDSASGKKGIMTLSGEITEQAEHNEISVCSDVWRNYRYIVESPRSEYLLLVDTESKTVTSRQYHGLTSPELVPCWSEAGKHLAWTDEQGYAGEISASELSLAPGLYPVATSLKDDAKYGFVSQSLRLEIAAIYENAMDFSDKLAAVKKDGKWGYINTAGVTVIPFEFDSCAAADCMKADCAFAFDSGLAPVCKDGKFGIINSDGETVVDFVFDAILQGENGVYIASQGGKWGIITVEKQHLEVETTTAKNTANANNEPALARGEYIVKTSGSVLNMRAASDSNAAVVAKIPNGTQLTVTKAVSGWAYVKYNSFTGWVSSDFLVQAPSTTAAASTTAVVNS